MLNQIYDTERLKIHEVAITLNQKWFDLCRTMDLDHPGARKNISKMQRWATEAQNRYAEIGFKVFVDLAPAINGSSPPSVVVEDRIEQHVFDHDKMAAEIKAGK